MRPESARPRPGARARAAAFRLEDLGPEQRRALERALRPGTIDDLTAVERARLETQLGAFIDALTDGAGPAALPAGHVARILRRPRRLRVDELRVRAVASAAFELRHEDLIASGTAGTSRSTKAPEAATGAEAPRGWLRGPWLHRPQAAPLPGAASRAAHFRLEQLDAPQLHAVESAMAPLGVADLATLDRAELEADLGAFIDVLSAASGPAAVRPRDLTRMLRNPFRLPVQVRRARAVARAAFELRHEELLAAGALNAPPSEAPEAGTAGAGLDLDALPRAHLAAIARHFLRRGVPRLSSHDRCNLEAHLQVFLTHAGHRDPGSVPPRKMARLLSKPGGGSDYAELQFRVKTLAASYPARRSIDWTRVKGTRRARLLGWLRRAVKRSVIALVAARTVSRDWLIGVAKGEIALPDPVALALSVPLFVVLQQALLTPEASERWFRRSDPLVWQWLEGASPIKVLVFAVVTALVAWRTPWKRLEEPWLRLLTTGGAIALALAACSTPANPYFDRAFLLDRAIILAFAALTWVTPAAIAPLIVSWQTLEQQTRFPYSGFEWLPTAPLLWLLLAILTTACWRVLVRLEARVAIAVLAIPVTASFLFSGFRTLTIGPLPWTWVLRERPGNLFASSWQHGWLSWLDENTVLLARRLLNLSGPALLAPLVVLLVLSAFAFGHRRLASIVFAGLLAAEVGLFLLTGFLWWGWWLATAVLAGAALTRRADVRALFSPSVVAVLWAAIALSPWLLRPPIVAWWSSTYNSRLIVEAVDDRGVVYRTAGWFAPYDAPFLLQRLHGIQSEQRLVDTHGITSHYGLFRRLIDLDANAGAEVDRFAAGMPPLPAELVARSRRRLDRLLREAVPTVHGERDWPWRVAGLRWLQPLSGSREAPGAPIREVRVRLEDSLVDDERLVVFRDRIVHRVQIAPVSGVPDKRQARLED